jgi:putative addiction module component (TIGR02574 family)
MSTAEQIRDLALRLPPAGRASLAKELIESLDPGEPADEVESAWIAEIESRAEALERGDATADDWKKSLERVREQLRKERKS